MAEVLCSHKMQTSKFLCNDPNGTGHLAIQVFGGVSILIDERIADKYPSMFTKIPTVEEALAQVEEIEPEPVNEVDEIETIEPEASEEPFAVDLTEAAGEIDEETEPVDADHGKAQLIEAIDDFKTKKKLLAYAKDCKVELDDSRKLKEMKEDLKTAWELI